MSWTVYMLQCRDRSLYTGIAKDMERRLAEHQDGSGAKYTRARRPLKLVYTERCETRSAALKREITIKALGRAQKLALVSAWQPTKSKRTTTQE